MNVKKANEIDKSSVEQKLAGSRPDVAFDNDVFIARTMAAVRVASAHETFDAMLRRTSTTKKERIIMKFKRLPKWAAISLASVTVLMAAGSAYAAYEVWLDPTHCQGNTAETCTSIYQISYGDKVLTNPHPTTLININPADKFGSADASVVPGGRTIQGKLVSHDGATFTLQASSGSSYTVTAGEDFIGEYNTKYAQGWQKYNQNGGNLSIALGDTLAVAYHQNTGGDPHHVVANEVESIGLVVTGDAKAETMQKL